MWESLALYLLCGVLAGLSAGLLGVGGGIVIVPFMVWQLPRQGVPDRLVMLIAVATSLAVIVVTSLSSAYAHHRRGAIRWDVVLHLVPGILMGSLAGAVVAEYLPTPLFKMLFGLFLMLVALRMTTQSPVPSRSEESTKVLGGTWVVAGTLIGFASSVLGIGGGTLSVPYLLKRGFPIRNAVATSSVGGFPIALAGTLTYLVLGWREQGLPVANAGYISIPAFLAIAALSVPSAPLGAWLAHHLPGGRLRVGFAVLLAVVGLRLGWQGFSTW
jgi:hypothetical protein